MTFSRERIQLLEIVQPRCDLRYGVAPCTASGGPNCYNCIGTCQDLANFNRDGEIRWRFCKPNAHIEPYYSASVDGNTIATDWIPILSSVSTSASKINISGARKGESPFGVTASLSAGFIDAPWDDRVGDYYLGTRPAIDPDDKPTFWQLFVARNPYVGDMRAVVYDGYVGQTMAEMTQREYVLTAITSNDGQSASLEGVDPLQALGDDDAYFPRTTPIQLYGDINSTTTSVQVYCVNADDLTDTFGNTVRKYIRINDEIIGYSAATETAPGTGIYTLSGVVRDALESTADSHSDETAMQRVGHYARTMFYNIEYDLIANHSRVDASYIPFADWQAVGDEELPYYQIEGTVHEPTKVGDLIGEIVQQCEHYIFWNERAREIQMAAIKPVVAPDGSITENDIMNTGQTLDHDPDSIYTRVFLYYRRNSPTGSLDGLANFSRMTGFIDGDAAQELGTRQELSIFSRWIRTSTQALLSAASITLRYSRVQRYMNLSIHVKDDWVEPSDVISVDTKLMRTSEGVRDVRNWQVIQREDKEPQFRIDLKLQEFAYRGRYGNWMADDAPDYADATDEERADGCFWADNDGLIDGEEGYRWQ